MADNEALVPQAPQVPIEMATLNITYQGQNGDLPDLVQFDMSADELKRVAAESVRAGYVPGINAYPNATFRDFEVDRFNATEEIPYNRLFLRPKTPFGG